MGEYKSLKFNIMRNLKLFLFLIPFFWSCVPKGETKPTLIVNEHQIAVDSVIDITIKISKNTSNPLQKDKLARDLISNIDSVYKSNKYLFKDIYGVIDGVNVYHRNIGGIEHSNIVASVVDRTNRSFKVEYKINHWTMSENLDDDHIYKSLCNIPQYSKVYISGLFDVNDNGVLNIESSYMGKFYITCKHTDSVKLVDESEDNLKI